MKTTRALLIASALLAMSACSSDETPNTSNTSTGSPTASRPTAIPSQARLSSGKATLTAQTPPETATMALDTRASQLSPTGTFAMQWRNDKGSILSMGGSTFSGTRRTSSSLVLVFQLKESSAARTYQSQGGECGITMTRSASGIAGTFECAAVPGGGGAVTNTYRVTGTFDAKR